MKIALKIILVISLGLISFGFYTNSNSVGGGELFIGIGVAIFAFVLMPLFVYHRYKGKDLSGYSLDNMLDKMEEEQLKKKNRRRKDS